jgi:hypothetical protein
MLRQIKRGRKCPQKLFHKNSLQLLDYAHTLLGGKAQINLFQAQEKQ